MPEATHNQATRERSSQVKSPAPTPEEGAREAEAEPLRVPEAAGGSDDPEARHAAVLGDSRLLQRSGAVRAQFVRQLQRGYGNGHVARVLARVQANAAPVQRREGAEESGEDRPPTEAEKAAALAAAAAAEQEATAAKGRGDSQTGQVKSAKTTEQAAGQTAKQRAATAREGAKAAAQAGRAEKESKGGAPAGRGRKRGASGGGEAISAPVATGANGERAPTKPEEDPGFQAVVGKIKGTAARQRAHPPAQERAAAAQAAAESPTSELEGKAQANQVGKMQQAPAPAFDAAGFKAKLMERIAALAPKNTQEADNFKKSNKLEGVKGEMQGQVAQEQERSQGPLEEQTSAAPDTSGVEPKPVTPLEPNQPGAPPAIAGAGQAAPKPRTGAEVEQPLRENSKQIDQQMAEADVSEEQLKKSNEPEFQGALEAKGQAQAHAQSGPQEFRQAEQAQLGQARAEAGDITQDNARAMNAGRGRILEQVGGKQNQTKRKDEQERAQVAADIKKIYEETKTSVEAKLNGLDAKVTKAFDEGAAAAKRTFEDYVDSRMKAYKERRYGGWFGWARWAKDKLAGMPSEVNVFYSDGRALYLREMDAVIDRVVAIIGTTLTEAKAEVARGKQRIQEYVAKLPANLKKVGQQAADEIQSQFDALEDQINNKQNELIDSLAQKYQENLQAVDARIEELKAANQGLIDKAINAVVGVIKTILKLKDMLLNVLARVADAVGKIIRDPIGFLSNLISGVKQGFLNFVDNIGTHLKKGLMTWLFGELAETGIEIPQSFDLKGILSLVMQILGLTWPAIRAQAVKILGERTVSVLEGAFQIFKVIKDQGIGGLWEYIQEQLGNLKEMVLDGIKDMVITQVIQAGVQWLLGILGGPAGAFIKAAKAIYDIVMWFVNNGSRVMALVNAFIDSIGAIASGSLGQAAQFIERTLANAIPVVIGFLASLLGLGNLGQKIRGIIQKIQQPVQKAIGWVLGKAKSFASKVMGKVKGAFGIKEQSPAEKEKRLKEGMTAGKSAVERLRGRRIGEALIRPALSVVKLRYRLAVLEPIVRNGRWAIHGEINRAVEDTNKEVEGSSPAPPLKEGDIFEAKDQSTGLWRTAVVTKVEPNDPNTAANGGPPFWIWYTLPAGRGSRGTTGVGFGRGGSNLKQRASSTDIEKDFAGIGTRFRRDSGEDHDKFEPKIIDVQYDLENRERIVTFVYDTAEMKGSRFIVKQRLDDHHTTSSSGRNLRIKPVSGRGLTEQAPTHETNRNMNNAHLIADYFGGSGYRQSLNLISTSREFNQQEMAGVERAIALQFVTLNADSFDLEVTVQWDQFLDSQATAATDNAIRDKVLAEAEEKSKASRQTRITAFLQEMRQRTQRPARRCLQVIYSGVYKDASGKSIGPIAHTIGPDKWVA